MSHHLTPGRRIRALAVTAVGVTLLAGCAGPGGSVGTADTFDPDEKVSLTLSFWGNDVRAEMYNEAVAAFTDEYPNIEVKTFFLAPTEYWEKRQIEAAGKGLPDVIAMDLGFLRQYTQNGSLLDLKPYLGDIIGTDDIDPAVLAAPEIDGALTGMPISTNAWGMYENLTLAEKAGIAPFESGTWEEYYDWTVEASDAAAKAGLEAWGTFDPSAEMTNFGLWLRAQGRELFDDDGTPGFDEDDLREFWNLPADARAGGGLVPQARVEEVKPLTAFDSALTLTDLIYDNTGSGFVGNLGEGYELGLVAPPLDEPGAKDLYLKVSQMLSIAANSEHPAAAAKLIDFLINSPESGEIFGTNRGIPASAAARDAADLNGISGVIADYETSIADRLGDAPPVPVIGYGSLEAKFRTLVPEINFGTLTVDEAVDQFFAEMQAILG